MPDKKARHLVVHAAEPDEFGRVELALRGGAADQRLHGDATPDDCDLAAVLGGCVIEIVREIERARARPILRNDEGIARKIFAEMAGEQAAIGVVAIAGRRKADEQLDLFSGERGRVHRGLAMCGGREYRRAMESAAQAHAPTNHALSATMSATRKSSSRTVTESRPFWPFLGKS